MNRKSRVGVVGLCGQSVFLDVPHLPGAGETVHATGLHMEPGGKGFNQACACAKMGVDTFFGGRIGCDEWGAACRDALITAGVEPLLSKDKEKPTAFAAIHTAAGGENHVAVYGGAAAATTPEDLDVLLKRPVLAGCCLLLAQMELVHNCLVHLLDIGEQTGIPIILNPAPAHRLSANLLHRIYALTPNENEAHTLLDVESNAHLNPEELAVGLSALGVRRAAITLGAQGAMILEDGETHLLPVYAVPHVADTTGAGDIFNGVLAACVAKGMSFLRSAVYAVVASGLSVQQHGVWNAIPDNIRVEVAVRHYYSELGLKEV